MSQWSHSRIESYRSCPRKFFFRYVQRVKLPEEPETLAQFLGGRAHDALEHLYREVRQGAVPTRDDLLGWFREAWAAEWHDAVMLPDERTPADHRAEGERWLADYHARHAPFAASRTIDVERRIQFPLDAGGEHQMIGFIDRIARTTDGTWQIHDYKTNRRLPTQQDKDRDPQLAYYEIGIRAMWPDEVRQVELVWHFLAFDTAITSRRDPEQLEALRGEALATIGEIEALPRDASAFPTRESALCDYCEYQSVCPVRKHRVAVVALPPERFAGESGVQLVNRWAEQDARRTELKAKIDAIEEEIAAVQDALRDYAEKHGLEVVTGDEREATVKRTEKVRFPRKSEPAESEEAEALETQLRASTWWGETSAVDRFALERLWKQRAAREADLRALLEEFGRPFEQVDVRLRKRKS